MNPSRLTLQEWRAVCPDITDEEWPLLIDVMRDELPSPRSMRVALAGFRRGYVAGMDRILAEQKERAATGKRGWPSCPRCMSRMLTITCGDCGNDRTVPLLTHWGYPLALQDQPRSDGRETAEALERAWPE